MITLIEARNFRLLRYIRQPLDAFHVLVGPNASGKTTFLDVISFLGDIIRDDVNKAISKRSPNYYDLTFNGKGGNIDLAVEALVPEQIRAESGGKYNTVRYELQIGFRPDAQEHLIREERVVMFDGQRNEISLADRSSEFPIIEQTPANLRKTYESLTSLVLLERESGKGGGVVTIHAESGLAGQPASGASDLLIDFNNPERSVLQAVAFFADSQQLPAIRWLVELLTKQVQAIALESHQLRDPSPPGRGLLFRTDGSNLPWMIFALGEDKRRFQHWLHHLRTALPDIEDIKTVERPENRSRYLVIHYANGAVVPSWLVSDGTLRLLALTLIAYLRDFTGIYLIEEPENGIHPAALETVYQSLSSVYDAQMLLATHSPVILGMVKTREVLCFTKTADGTAAIVRGDHHPALRDWKGGISLGTLFASGVLG